MALTALENRMLQLWRDNLGDLMPQTAEDALEAAIEAEQTAGSLGPYDPARAHFKIKQIRYEALALLLEKEQS